MAPSDEPNLKSIAMRAIRSREDVGVFLLGGSLGGLADAIVNFAAFESAYTTAFLTASLALGVKKLLIDKDGQELAKMPKKPSKEQ